MSGVSIFMHHQVGRFAPMRDHCANCGDVDRFRTQMRYRKWIGATVLPMSEALRRAGRSRQRYLRLFGTARMLESLETMYREAIDARAPRRLPVLAGELAYPRRPGRG
ncbi:hypothetical protein [Solimonas soli]|uniref:hypothetical protein n=1 Tax=Solimonas soli TaxID=413479 RepID=UPI000482EA2D|nr:hypothetical protein [Solimonas soli]